MNRIRRFWRWLFSVPEAQRSTLDIVLWWESRRIAYNFIVGSVGFISLLVFFAAISSVGVLKPGEDAVEPLAVLVAPIFINVCYSAGWIAELALHALWPDKQSAFGPLLFKLGLGFSLLVVTFPAIFWLSYWLQQAYR